MEEIIQAGDNVRHRTQKNINGGLVMSVDDTNETHALCSHFKGEETVYTQTWFPKEDLELVNKVDGGFF